MTCINDMGGYIFNLFKPFVLKVEIKILNGYKAGDNFVCIEFRRDQHGFYS